MSSETREITVEVDENNREWLEITAREYGLPVGDAANELLRHGLIHHEEAIDGH